MVIGILLADYATATTEGQVYLELSLASPAPAAVGGTRKLKTPEPVNLPDPRLLCDQAEQKLCVPFENRELDFQSTKGVFYVVR